jgi:hypothetical protein
MLHLERNDATLMVGNGLQYWRWTLSEYMMELGDCEIKDFVVLLQRDTREEGEYTIVTKEWSLANVRAL